METLEALSDNQKMLLRYTFAIAVSFAVGKGWIVPSLADPVTELLVTAGIELVAWLPAAWAWFKVRNEPV